MDLGFWVIEGRLGHQRLGSSIDGDAAGIRVHDEAVVDIGFLFAKCEWFVRSYTWVLFDRSSRDTASIDDLVFV